MKKMIQLKSHFNADYLDQDGYKLYNNITLKGKTFIVVEKFKIFSK